VKWLYVAGPNISSASLGTKLICSLQYIHLMEGEVTLCYRSQYQFLLGYTIPNILVYFLITSVGIPTKPSAVPTQPIHRPSYKVDMFFIIHASNGRRSSFMLQVPISVPPFGSYHSKYTILLDNFSRQPNQTKCYHHNQD
jgi:hypothetical protein